MESSLNQLRMLCKENMRLGEEYSRNIASLGQKYEIVNVFFVMLEKYSADNLRLNEQNINL